MVLTALVRDLASRHASPLDQQDQCGNIFGYVRVCQPHLLESLSEPEKFTERCLLPRHSNGPDGQRGNRPDLRNDFAPNPPATLEINCGPCNCQVSL